VQRCKSQKEHIEIYGHCCAPQDIVNIQNKDLRNLKCNICDLTNKNKTLAQENLKLKESNKSFQDEIALLKTKIIELEDVDEYEKFTDCN
jgi:predicted nuclease with TOPRIM domain